jgi:hypothetical protein
MRSAMLGWPGRPAGVPGQSAGGGSSGGAPSVKTGPSRPSRAKAAVARTMSLPSCASTDSPNAVVRPLRITDVRMLAGPAAPGLRKKPEITTGSGNGICRASARTQVASM